jgi:hypothetical protein
MSDLDFKLLINMRHQLKKTTTMHTSIIQEFHAALKEAQDDTASGTGVEQSTLRPQMVVVEL